MDKNEKTTWCIPVNRILDTALEQAVKRDSHSSKAEFVRDSVRRQLEELGYKPQIFANQKE